MARTIKLSELIGTDIRSRINTVKLRNEIAASDSSQIEVDMTDVIFISRSVADELINISEDFIDKKVKFVGLKDEPQTMLDIVAKSRKTERVRNAESRNQEITVLHDMKSVAEYFSTL